MLSKRPKTAEEVLAEILAPRPDARPVLRFAAPRAARRAAPHYQPAPAAPSWTHRLGRSILGAVIGYMLFSIVKTAFNLVMLVVLIGLFIHYSDQIIPALSQTIAALLVSL
jgi:hypothetical protein